MNIKRRHLSKSQLATIAVEMIPLFEEEAKKRQIAGLKQGEEKPVVPVSAQREEKGKAIEKVADIVGIGKSKTLRPKLAQVKEKGFFFKRLPAVGNCFFPSPGPCSFLQILTQLPEFHP